MQMLPFLRPVPVISGGQLEVFASGLSLLPAVFPVMFTGRLSLMHLNGVDATNLVWRHRTLSVLECKKGHKRLSDEG